MKQIRYLFGGLLFLFASIGSVTAQEVSDYSKLQPSDYSSITLPPLDLLFENAKSAPTYELATVKEQIERKLRKREKAFLSFFSLRGSYQYGMFGNESTFTDVAIAPISPTPRKHKKDIQLVQELTFLWTVSLT